MAPSSLIVAALFRMAEADSCLDESSMLQMDFKKGVDLASDQSMGQVIDYAVLETACRCPGYYQDQCVAEAAQGCFWGFDEHQNTGEWCQCGPVPEVDPNAQAPVGVCPAGWEQQGAAGADIGGCGLQSCDARYDLTSEAACATRCDALSECAGFSWAPMNGDRNHPGVTACTIYNSATPTGTWTGTEGIATQVFCSRPAPATQPFFTGSWNGNRNNWNGEVGYSFSANRDFTLTHLGRHLYNGALAECILVSLWQTGNTAALATAPVCPTSTVEGDYAFEELSSSVSLTSGTEYRLTQQCYNGMPDRWFDSSTFAESQADSSAADFIGGCYQVGNGYPARDDGTNRRPGMVNFKFV